MAIGRRIVPHAAWRRSRARLDGDAQAQLFITDKTASVHVSNILAKLGVATRGEAAALAHRAGFELEPAISSA